MLLARCSVVCVEWQLDGASKRKTRFRSQWVHRTIRIPFGKKLQLRRMFYIYPWEKQPALLCMGLAAEDRAGLYGASNANTCLDVGSDEDGKGGDGKVVAPLVSALRECAEMEVAAFHFPGHRRGAGAPPIMAALIGAGAFAADLPELPELDNLHAAEGVIAEAQDRAALLFGAQRTWFLINGSTCGIQAAVMATCAPGDYLVLPRNAHMSAVSAMILSGAQPKYVTPTLDAVWGLAHGVAVAEVKAAIVEVENRGGRVGAVLVVSPTYFGVCSQLGAISGICHTHGVPLVVDEAHGAHFRFHPKLPPTALEQGADVAVQSTHKVLGSLTQSAMLHTQGTLVDYDRIAQCLQMLQSSSPSYLLLSSLDAARAQMSGRKQFVDTEVPQPDTTIMDGALSLAFRARKALQQVPGIFVLDMQTLDKNALAECSIAGVDPLRITVGLWDLGVNGFEADDILRLEHGVVAELPSLFTLTFVVSLGTSQQDVMRFVDAFATLSAQFFNRNETARYASQLSSAPLSGNRFSGVWDDQVAPLSPREAFYAKWERVELADVVGRVSVELLCPYPPGIPIIAPGEVFTQAAVDYIASVLGGGGIVTGASDSSFTSARVVCR